MANTTREISIKPRCLVAIPQAIQFQIVAETLEKSVREAGLELVRIDPASKVASLREIIMGELARSDCLIADVTGKDANVFFEIGLAQAMGKATFFVVESNRSAEVVTELGELPLISYSRGSKDLGELAKRLTRELRTFRHSPRRGRTIVASRLTTPFFVDWSRLERVERENLCRELLMQMGFQRVDWLKESREIDIIAELPKKDPDGYQYPELWLVAMGRNMPIEVVIDHAMIEPERFLRRFIFNEDQRERLLSRRSGEAPFTLLCIALDDSPRQQTIFEFDERRLRQHNSGSPPIRLRVWDRNHLTSLVQQFRHIGYKYFSDEGRARSKFRKTPEELYNENVTLAERVTATVTALESEKNLRVRAERDAVWKDISFSTAHKIGNPLFAIETFLDPLERRIGDGRSAEAEEIVRSMRSAVERAKVFVEQFKSLTKAQELTVIPTLLRPLLMDACRVAEGKALCCEVNCPEDTMVCGDPARLAECFEELTANAMRWVNKAEPKIIVTVVPDVRTLPPELDTAKNYVLIQFRDNGAGIKGDCKTRIFDAFYTTHEHGTGLGLALVRRIIEGHGGTIFENGTPGIGADFEIFLPSVESKAI